MAQYIIEMDSSVHADATAAQTAITDAGGTITKTYSFAMTYKVTAETSQYDAISGKKYGELVDAERVVTPAFNTNHLKMLCNHFGNSHVAYSPQSTGSGEHIYLLDTGVNTTHDEFAGSTVNNLYTGFGSDFADADGHGTVMASLIVGDNIGTAKDATLHNVRMMDANPYTGTVADVIDALEAINEHHNANTPSHTKTVVACWTASKNSLIDSKFKQLEDNNMVIVAAAGNDGLDVDNYSPAGLDSVLTVGAMNSQFNVGMNPNNGAATNLGEEVDIYAIGEDVSVVDTTSTSAYVTADGTSVAAAQIAGLVAQFTDLYPSSDAFKTKSHVVTSGMVEFRGTNVSFDPDLITSTGATESSLKESVGVSPQTSDVELSALPSGVIATVQPNTNTTIDLQINANASNVGILDFSPLPPWMTVELEGPDDDWAKNKSELIIDTTANMTGVTVPGIYHFSIRGTIGGVDSINEFSVGLYNTSVAELDASPEFYYDSEETSYDQVVNFNAAKGGGGGLFTVVVFNPGGGFLFNSGF